MTPQELKSSILQLAIQGKLVEQCPEEGSAEELYQKIQEEKQALIKAGKIKKEKPLPEITEDEISFDIPESWTWIRLGDYCQKVTDQVASGSFASLRENVPSLKEPDYAVMVKTADFANGFSRNLTYTTKHGYEFLENSNLFGGELILSNIGSIGKCFIVPKLGCKMTLAPNAVMVRLVNDELRDYLYYYILSPQGYQALLTITSGTAMKKFNKTDLKKVLLPIPPLAEQKRIVAKIEELLPYIDRYEQAWSILENFNKRFPVDMQKSILQMAIQGKLVEQRPEEGTGEELYQQIQAKKQKLIKAGTIKKEKPLPEISEDEIPFDIPETWKWAYLLDIIEEKPSNGYSPKGVNYITNVRNLTLTATTSGYFKPDAYKYVDIKFEQDSKYWLKHYDLLVQRSNSRELVGTSCIYTGKDNEFIYPDLMMRMRVIDGINVQYVDYVLKSPMVRNYYMLSASGTSESMPKINQKTVSYTLIPLPPLDEQKRIVAKLEEILPLCERLK